MSIYYKVYIGSVMTEQQNANSKQDSFAIIGEAISGWSAALTLLLQGCTDITMIEKRSDAYARHNQVALKQAAVEHILKNYVDHGDEYNITFIGVYRGTLQFKLERDPKFGPSTSASLKINPIEQAIYNPLQHFEDLVKKLQDPNLDVAEYLAIKSNVDSEFLSYVNHKHGAVLIPVLQHYLQAKTLIKARELGVKINIQQGDVQKIDKSDDSGKFVVKTKESAATEFDHVIVASGARGVDLTKDLSDVADSERQELPVTIGANVTNCAINMRVNFNAIVDEDVRRSLIADINSRTGIGTFKGSRLKKTQALRDLGWTSNRAPIYFSAYNNANQSFYLAGEFPGSKRFAIDSVANELVRIKELYESARSIKNVTKREARLTALDNMFRDIVECCMDDKALKEETRAERHLDKVIVSKNLIEKVKKLNKTEQQKLFERVSIAKLDAWAKEIYRTEYPGLRSVDKAVELYGRDKVNATTFELTPSYVKNPHIKVGDGHVLLAGDAQIAPNYFLGHGANGAVLSGYAAAACFKSGRFVDAKPYDDTIKLLLTDYFSKINVFNQLLYLRRIGVLEPVKFILEKMDDLGKAKAKVKKRAAAILPSRILGGIQRRHKVIDASVVDPLADEKAKNSHNKNKI